MKTKRAILRIGVLTLCLSLAMHSVQAQQASSGSGKTQSSAVATSKINSSQLIAQVLRGRRPGFSLLPSSRHGGVNGLSASAAAAAAAVHGTGTVGTISMWLETSPSGNSILGDSIITQLNGNIGIGLTTPVSKLSVQGMIETTLGGYKFPDGTVQTTAAVSGLQSVIHNATLTGAGTTGSPLGVAVPLTLDDTTPGFILGAFNRQDGGSGVYASGANTINGLGGEGIVASGGPGGSFKGGRGVRAHGGVSETGEGGTAVGAFGGNSISGPLGGAGVESVGGSNIGNGDGGDGVNAMGGAAIGSGNAGIGVRAHGADDAHTGGTGAKAIGGGGFFNVGGSGVIAVGGENHSGVGGGTGVEATGGNSELADGGVGLIARGGNSNGGFGGTGLFATGGNGPIPSLAAVFGGGVHVNGNLDVLGPAGGGNLTVTGDLSVTGTKNFKIDHPLDPANKYLLHASIESSEVLNIYSGNIVTDAKGEAVVSLPEWFEVLNRDLRYQLTVISTFAQAIVAEKVKHNRFTIRTSAPGVEVSWQVTGVRSDAAMRKQPFKAEENKAERERGTYLTPDLFSKPEELGEEWARSPEIMQQLRQRQSETGQKAKRQPGQR